MNPRTLQAAIICHDDNIYLPAVIESLKDVPTTVFISRLAWSGGQPGDFGSSIQKAESAGASVILGDWSNEEDQRNFVIAWALENGIDDLIIPDSDEILCPKLLDTLRKISAVGLADVVFTTMDTYWKSPEYVIRPRERLMPPILVSPASVSLDRIRNFRGERPLMLSEEHGLLHHLSYSGPDDRIRRKISTWSHKDEVVPRWWHETWKAWDEERTARNLHPTHPEAYGRATRRNIPEELRSAWNAFLLANGKIDPLHPPAEIDGMQISAKVSVIIPVYGGPEDLRLCLLSLEKCLEIIHEVIVVDDCSQDCAPDVASEFGFCKLIRNPQNIGFSGSCNIGASAASGEILLFLNSDTVVPRIGLQELIRSLERSPAIGAAGPVSNAVGHLQMINADYELPDGLDLFAEDVALSGSADMDCDMLVGFCLAVRKSAWDEMGGFDERFEVGMFEDNDLCYRLRRAGYRLVISRRSFVHHKGNASLERTDLNKEQLFQTNHRRYLEKWSTDIQSGFASTLAGLCAQRIRFFPANLPEERLGRVKELAAKAKISLCMIVRNEERVLEACLNSAQPFFSEIIIVDTGSTDRTMQIARSFGAVVNEVSWPDSFAEARNVSLEHATGKWIFWMDADDTLPFGSGETLLNAAINAPEEIAGFVVPVRFVNDDPTFGTVVDHVKLFRNSQKHRFEGRIHEQILPAIRASGGEIVRLPVEVLHSGYDTSPGGQEQKRQRDDKLLKLELAERPNHPFVLFNLGMTAHFNGRHEEAIEWLAQCLNNSVHEESHIRKAYALMAVSFRELGRLADALGTTQTGLKACPDDPELLFHRSIIFTRLERIQEAMGGYQRLLEIGPQSQHFSSADNGIFSYKAEHNLAGLYLAVGNYRAARDLYLKSMESNPRHLNSTFELFRAAIEFGDEQTAKRCLDHVEKIEGKRQNWQSMWTDLAKAFKKF